MLHLPPTVYLTFGIIFVAAVTALTFLFAGEPRPDMRVGRGYRFAFLLVLGVAVVGWFWHHEAITHFAKQAGGLTGMVMHPVTSDKYEYSPNGKYYEMWAFDVPLYTTFSLLAIIGIAASVVLYRRGNRLSLIGLWCEIVAAAGCILLYSIWQYIEAINLFI